MRKVGVSFAMTAAAGRAATMADRSKERRVLFILFSSGIRFRSEGTERITPPECRVYRGCEIRIRPACAFIKCIFVIQYIAESYVCAHSKSQQKHAPRQCLGKGSRGHNGAVLRQRRGRLRGVWRGQK